MKRFHVFLLLASLFTFCGCNKGKLVKIILLAGQSNMEGHDSPWNELPEETINEYRNGHSNVKINYDCTYEITQGGVANTSNGEFVDVDFGQGRNQTLFGPEVGVASYLGKHDPNQTYYLIKSCEGSSDLKGDWSKTGHCYLNFVKDVDYAVYFDANGVDSVLGLT